MESQRWINLAETILTMPHRMIVYVVTSTLFSGAISASQSLTTQPSDAVKLKIEVSGDITPPGTLTITGTLDGAAQSEVMTYDQARTKTSTKFYDAINASGVVASAGLQGGTIEIKQVDGGGAEVMTETATRTYNGRMLKCQFLELSPEKLVFLGYGIQESQRYLIRTIYGNPICTASQTTQFSVSHKAYSGDRFVRDSETKTITPPGKRSSPEVRFYAIKVK